MIWKHGKMDGYLDTLADLFKQHKSNHIDGLLPYFENHDMSYVSVSRAPIEQIEVVRKRMGWKFCWVSPITPISIMTSKSPLGRRK